MKAPASPSTALRRERRGRSAVAGGVFLLLLLTAGCHKRAQVSRYPPPPPRAGGRIPAAPRPPAILVPAPGDNAVPTESVLTGYASWYAPSGRRASNGEYYDGNSMTAAHRTLPLATVLRVTNLATNQATTVRITDRGPFVHGRMLDLSPTAAKSIGVYRMGVAPIRMEILQAGPGTSAAGRWAVQVGAFADSRNASRLHAELARQYSATARVIEFQGSTGMWVRVDPVQSDRLHALAIVQAMRVEEPAAQAWLVRLD